MWRRVGSFVLFVAGLIQCFMPYLYTICLDILYLFDLRGCLGTLVISSSCLFATDLHGWMLASTVHVFLTDVLCKLSSSLLGFLWSLCARRKEPTGNTCILQDNAQFVVCTRATWITWNKPSWSCTCFLIAPFALLRTELHWWCLLPGRHARSHPFYRQWS